MKPFVLCLVLPLVVLAGCPEFHRELTPEQMKAARDACIKNDLKYQALVNLQGDVVKVSCVP